MTKKLENASGNFLEMVECVQKGEVVQWQSPIDSSWCKSDYEITKPELIIKELADNVHLKWRKKPDAFEEAWERESNDIFYALLEQYGLSDTKRIFKHGWDAAMEHKDNEV